jgi:hypothetical protein
MFITKFLTMISAQITFNLTLWSLKVLQICQIFIYVFSKNTDPELRGPTSNESDRKSWKEHYCVVVRIVNFAIFEFFLNIISLKHFLQLCKINFSIFFFTLFQLS